MGNFYSLMGDENTLRGLFIVQSINRQSKKVSNGSWKAMAPVVCKITSQEDGIVCLNRQAQCDCGHQTLSGFAL